MKSFSKYIIMFLVFFSLQSVSNSQSKSDCGDLQTTLEMNQCYEREFNQADKKLNEAYQNLTKILLSMEKFNSLPKESLVNSLKKAQRSWIEFRDKNCDYVYDIYCPGSEASSEYILCKIKMTNERTKELTNDVNFWKRKGY